MSSDQAVGWNCPTNPAGESFGFNDSGIEHFAGDPFSAIAREIAQNTNDAAREKPAYLEFRQIDVPKAEFPNRDQFVAILQQCAEAATEEGDKAVKFFERAGDLINQDRIPILVARDRNTTGIEGPCVRGRPYHAFMKSSGTSKKQDQNSGGSFGIGKNAPFAISDFRTVFVLSRYRDDEGVVQQLAQGKSILISHGEGGTEFTNNAYWGEIEKFEPVEGDSGAVPSWMTNPFGENAAPQDLGTTLFVAGFRTDAKWAAVVAAYVLQNFFAAIKEGNLVVEVGEYLINRETIRDLFADDDIHAAVSEYPNQPEAFASSRAYFECMVSDETIHETSQQLHLGKTAVGILVGDQYPKRVAVVRNGMLITDSLDKLRRFSGMKNFVAVVECQSQVGNELLRRMEPPRHDGFQPDRLAPREEIKRGRTALRHLAEFVRGQLDRHAKNEISERVNIEELSDLLGSDAVGADPDKQGEANPTGKISLAARRRPKGRAGRKQEFQGRGLGQGFESNESTGAGGDLGDSQGSGGHGAVPSGDGPLAGVGDGEQPASPDRGRGEDGRKKSRAPVPLELHGVRGVRVSSRTRRVTFSSQEEGDVRLVFERVGADANSDLKVVTTSEGEVEAGAVKLDVAKMSKTSVEVTFDSDVDGAVKVVAHAL